MTRRLLVVPVLLAALAGCSSDTLSSGQQGFISAEGSIVVRAEQEREPVGDVRGTTLDGDEIALSDLRGEIVVMPLWGSWCGPCRAEAPMLAEAAKDLADDGVTFLGLNVRDQSVDKAQGLVRTAGIEYSSIYDPSGAQVLKLDVGITPYSIPSTAFIDEDGRVAAVVIDKISRTTLYDVIEEIRGTSAS